MNRRKGFTLIELLVVIAIIGILATIVLVNLNTARNKAKIAAIKAAMSELRAAGELFYDSVTPNTYFGFDASNDENRIATNISDNGGTTYLIAINGAIGFCAEVILPGGGLWCIDSTGYVGVTSNCAALVYACQ